MTSPLVSAIMPARNVEKTIGSAIASVLEQTMPDFELIVIDDASADQTAALAGAIKDRRIRLLKSARNIGHAAARNWGVKNAKGKWAAFLDADDEWMPWRLERLLRVAYQKECYVADLEVLAVPGPSGRLARAAAPRQIEDGSVAELNLETALHLSQDIRPMLPVSWFGEVGVEFPEWGSCGEWAFLLARLSALGKQGRIVRLPGYLYRAQAAHYSSTLRGRQELVNVLEVLVADDAISRSSRLLLSNRLAYAQEGLVAAALRCKDAHSFFAYAIRYPRVILRLPRRLLLFVVAKIRSFLATAALARGFDPALRG